MRAYERLDDELIESPKSTPRAAGVELWQRQPSKELEGAKVGMAQISKLGKVTPVNLHHSGTTAGHTGLRSLAAAMTKLVVYVQNLNLTLMQLSPLPELLEQWLRPLLQFSMAFIAPIFLLVRHRALEQ